MLVSNINNPFRTTYTRLFTESYFQIAAKILKNASFRRMVYSIKKDESYEMGYTFVSFMIVTFHTKRINFFDFLRKVDKPRNAISKYKAIYDRSLVQFSI